MTRKVSAISLVGPLALVFGLMLTNIPSARAADAATVYKTKCAPCHAPDGTGKTTAGQKMGVRDFHSPEVQAEKDATLIEITTSGKNKMPGFGKSLKPEEIKSLVEYIRELGKTK